MQYDCEHCGSVDVVQEHDESGWYIECLECGKWCEDGEGVPEDAEQS
jgi:hypothetical protein